MAKKTSKAQGSRGKTRRKPSKVKDLPADRKARTVKGGAFSPATTGGGLRSSVSGLRWTFTNRNTV